MVGAPLQPWPIDIAMINKQMGLISGSIDSYLRARYLVRRDVSGIILKTGGPAINAGRSIANVQFSVGDHGPRLNSNTTSLAFAGRR